MTIDPSFIDRARELSSREGGLAIVVVYRLDGSAHASVVNAGVLPHPLTDEPVVGFVVQGSGRKKAAYLRARPEATVVFRSGRDWIAIEGTADLIGPDDHLEGVSAAAMPIVFREIYSAAIGGQPSDWATLDGVIETERHTAVLVRPTRTYSSPPGG